MSVKRYTYSRIKQIVIYTNQSKLTADLEAVMKDNLNNVISQFYIENVLENIVILGLVGIMFSAVKTLA